MRGVRCAVVNYVLVATVGHIEYSIYICQFQTISVFFICCRFAIITSVILISMFSVLVSVQTLSLRCRFCC